MKQVIVGVLIVAAIIGGAVVLGKKDEGADGGTQSSHFYGKEDATVTLVEYGDFECPACGQYFPLVKQIKEEFKDDIRFEFRHFPIVSAHPTATAAHRAAEAAGKQGKFWEMHDQLYERQMEWRSTSSSINPNAIKTFETYAQELGLNVEQFKTDYSAGSTLGTISADTARGNTDGVTGTPSFYINGKKIEENSTFDSIEEMRKAINDSLGRDTSSETPVDSTTEETTPAPIELQTQDQQ